MTRWITGALLAAVVVARCSQVPQVPQPQPAPSPSTTGPVVAQRYATVEALRDAALAWGYNCPAWVQDNVVLNAAESGHCSDADVFATFATDADLHAGLENLRSMDELSRANGLEASTHLVGPNWIINAPEPDIARLAVKIGGTVEHWTGASVTPA